MSAARRLDNGSRGLVTLSPCLKRLECLFWTRFIRVGQLHGLFGRRYRIGLAAGDGQHLCEHEVPFPLLWPAADPGPGGLLGDRPVKLVERLVAPLLPKQAAGEAEAEQECAHGPIFTLAA